MKGDPVARMSGNDLLISQCCPIGLFDLPTRSEAFSDFSSRVKEKILFYQSARTRYDEYEDRIIEFKEQIKEIEKRRQELERERDEAFEYGEQPRDIVYNDYEKKLGEMSAKNSQIIDKISEFEELKKAWNVNELDCRQAKDLCSEFELFMRDFLIERVLSNGKYLKEAENSNIQLCEQSESPDMEKWRITSIEALNNKHKNFQNLRGSIRTQYEKWFPWGSDRFLLNCTPIINEPSYNINIKEITVDLHQAFYDILLLVALRHRIEHSGGDTLSNEYKNTYFECRKRLEDKHKNTDSTATPKEILESNSPRNKKLSKLCEFHQSLLIYAFVFSSQLLMIESAPFTASIKKQLFADGLFPRDL